MSQKELFQIGLGLETSCYLSLADSVIYSRERDYSPGKLKMKQEKQNDRNPSFPREIIDMVLSFIPADNNVVWGDKVFIYVDGLLPHAVFNASILLPHYENPFSNDWTLQDIAKQGIKKSILEDARLTNSIELRVKTFRSTSGLRSLMEFPHQWKSLLVIVNPIPIDESIDLIVERCEKLSLVSRSVPSSVPPEKSRTTRRSLKTIFLSFITLTAFFNRGLLSSILNLSLYGLDPSSFSNYDTFKNAVDELPRILSQLPCLNELKIDGLKGYRDDLDALPRVNSISLRCLYIHVDDAIAIPFLSLFSSCRVDCFKLEIQVEGEKLREAERIVPHVRHIYIKVRTTTCICVETIKLTEVLHKSNRITSCVYSLNESKTENLLSPEWSK